MSEPLFGTRNRGEEHREIRQVEADDHCEEGSATAICPPAEHAESKFKEERSRGQAAVQSRPVSGTMQQRGERNIRIMGHQVEHQVRCHAKTDGCAEARPARERSDNPRQRRCAEHGHHGMRKRHVGEVDVADISHCGLGGCSLNADVVQRDPEELHPLHGDEDRNERDVRVSALDEKSSRSMVNGEHERLLR